MVTEMINPMTELFGEVISSYSREQAHEDGALIAIDREEFDGATLFKFPVSITSALWADLERGQGKDARTLKGRVWDVCYMMSVYAKQAGGRDISFPTRVGKRNLELHGNIGPGDDPAPVITIGFPQDF